ATALAAAGKSVSPEAIAALTEQVEQAKEAEQAELSFFQPTQGAATSAGTSGTGASPAPGQGPTPAAPNARVNQDSPGDEEVTASGFPEPPRPRSAPVAPQLGEDTIFTGALLRQLREARNISLKEIADRTRIGAASLRAVEEERYEQLPDARIYIRG